MVLNYLREQFVCLARLKIRCDEREKKQEDMNTTDFYLQTSEFTELGFYKEFARNLPDDINELCLLQRYQTIHPVGLLNPETRMDRDGFWGNLSEVPLTRLNFEEDYFPNALSMFAELLRLNPSYTKDRTAKDKIHITCRCQSIMLAATLKAKGIPARVRSGYADYIRTPGNYFDHWITEYYNKDMKQWILVDADIHCDPHIDFDSNNIPRDRYLTGAQAYLKLRKGELSDEQLSYASWPITHGMAAAIRGVFYDFHCLMNHEIIFLHQPAYVSDKNFELSVEELTEIDQLAELMLNPDVNFGLLQDIWNQNQKFRILRGGLN